MPDTGEDREIKWRVNAKEAEVIREEKRLDQKLKTDLNLGKKAPGHRKSKSRQ